MEHDVDKKQDTRCKIALARCLRMKRTIVELQITRYARTILRAKGPNESYW